MSQTAQTPSQSPAPAPAVEQQTLKARDLLWLCLSRWYWFVISLAVCLGLGVYYIMNTPAVSS